MSISAPQVSVIIPTYNCEAYIVETIDSVLAQTLRELEVIVVDDGSTDRTREIVAAYGAPVRLFVQSNSGVCRARNKGLAEAQGDFVCFLDHDDYWFPGKLERQVEEMRSHPEVGVVFAQCVWWHPDSTGRFAAPATFNFDKIPDEVDPTFSGWIYHQFLLECCPLTSTAMIRREVLQRCGTFDESLPYSEDWDLFLRISLEYPYLMLRRPNTLYRQHPRQGSRVPRKVDYRSRLILNAVKKWGLRSRDGRCISRMRFRRQLADFHLGFGLLHLQSGDFVVALRAILSAIATYPFKPKYFAYLTAALLGWRPKW